MKQEIIEFFNNKKQKLVMGYENIENKYFTKPLVRKNIFIFSIIFFTTLMYILNHLTPLLVDDYAFGYITGTGASNYLWIITPILMMILIFKKYSINQNVIRNNLANSNFSHKFPQ